MDYGRFLRPAHPLAVKGILRPQSQGKVSARSVSLGGCALHPPLRFWACASWLLQISKAAAAQQ